MRLLRTRRTFDYRPDMTPLIDIVFQLIIFFMVVMTIAKVEVSDLTVPEAEQGRRLRRRPTDVTINVRRDGRILLGGVRQNPADLARTLARRVLQGPLRVHVRGDRDVPFASVRGVMRACRAAGIRDIVVAVLPPGEGRTP